MNKFYKFPKIDLDFLNALVGVSVVMRLLFFVSQCGLKSSTMKVSRSGAESEVRKSLRYIGLRTGTPLLARLARSSWLPDMYLDSVSRWVAPVSPEYGTLAVRTSPQPALISLGMED